MLIVVVERWWWRWWWWWWLQSWQQTNVKIIQDSEKRWQQQWWSWHLFFSWLPINCKNTIYIPWDPFISFFCCFPFLGFCFPSFCIWIRWGGCWCRAHAHFFLTFILTRSTTDVNNYIFLRINTDKVATLKGQVTTWWGGNIYWFKPFLVGKPWWRILLWFCYK